MIDCLLIAPGNSPDIYQGLNHTYSAVEPPIWAGLLANALKAHEKEVQIFDVPAQSEVMLKSVIEEAEPKLIAIVVYGQQPSASTQNMHSAGKIARDIRRNFPEQKILMLGGHVSALPELTMATEACDYAAKGEGLNTILGLLSGQSLDTVPGLFYRELDAILQGPKDKVATDLAQTYPGVAWDLLPMNLYRAHNWHCFGRLETRSSYASIYSSLGCPFKCSFCCINAPFDSNSFRFWRPEFTINQIHHLYHHGVTNIKIADEMFVLREDHFLKLCDLIIDLEHDINFWAYARVDTVKEKYLEKLKKAGVNWLALGIESGSKHVRDGVIKRFQTQDIVDVVRRIKDAGIHVIGNFIFGLPDDTMDTMEETYSLAVDLNCEMVNFYCAMAYPGSQLYPLALQKGWQLPSTWLGYSQHSYDTTPLPTDTLAPGDVLRFRDSAFHRYFSNEKYLGLIRDKFGIETEKHVKEMAQIDLKRKLLGD